MSLQRPNEASATALLTGPTWGAPPCSLPCGVLLTASSTLQIRVEVHKVTSVLLDTRYCCAENSACYFPTGFFCRGRAVGAAAAKGSVMKCAVGDLGRENSCVNSSHPSTAIGNCSTPLVMAGGYSPPCFIPSARAQVSKCPGCNWSKGTAHPQPRPQ